MIPKIIHYCWFGNKEKSKKIKKCINSWRKITGYKMVEWNETNCNLEENEYIKSAYENKQYAFVSDYIRLKVLYEYGGIYLDTDVEVKKKFKDEFLHNKLILSFMYNCCISTAIIGAEKNNKDIKKILDSYSEKKFTDNPNNNLFTNYLISNYREFLLNNKEQVIDDAGIRIYPKEYFEAPTLSKKMGYSIHHFEASWQKEKNIGKKILRLFLSKYIYHLIIRRKAIYSSPFYKKYINDKRV